MFAERAWSQAISLRAGSTGVLRQHLGDVERVQLTVAQSVGSLGYVREEAQRLCQRANYANE